MCADLLHAFVEAEDEAGGDDRILENFSISGSKGRFSSENFLIAAATVSFVSGFILNTFFMRFIYIVLVATSSFLSAARQFVIALSNLPL